MVAMTSGNMLFHGARMIHNTVQAAKTLKMRRQQIAAKWMGPPTHNDPEYSNDPSSGEEKEKPIVKEEKEDPDDSPDLDNLKIPEQEPAEGKSFGHLEIHFPKELFDAQIAKPKIEGEPDIIPRPVLEDSSTASEPEVDDKEAPDIDIETPMLGGVEVVEPQITIDENSWPKPDTDYIPDQPGQTNDLGIEMP